MNKKNLPVLLALPEQPGLPLDRVIVDRSVATSADKVNLAITGALIVSFTTGGMIPPSGNQIQAQGSVSWDVVRATSSVVALPAAVTDKVLLPPTVNRDVVLPAVNVVQMAPSFGKKSSEDEGGVAPALESNAVVSKATPGSGAAAIVLGVTASEKLVDPPKDQEVAVTALYTNNVGLVADEITVTGTVGPAGVISSLVANGLGLERATIEPILSTSAAPVIPEIVLGTGAVLPPLTTVVHEPSTSPASLEQAAGAPLQTTLLDASPVASSFPGTQTTSSEAAQQPGKLDTLSGGAGNIEVLAGFAPPQDAIVLPLEAGQHELASSVTGTELSVSAPLVASEVFSSAPAALGPDLQPSVVPLPTAVKTLTGLVMPTTANVETKLATPVASATTEIGLGQVITKQAYRKEFIQWSKDMLALKIKEVGANAGPPSKLFMDGKSGKAWPWCVAAATGGDLALKMPFDTKLQGVQPNGRMWYTQYLVNALKAEPGSAVYSAKDFLTGDHMNGKVGIGDYLMYYDGNFGRHTARIFAITKKGYWSVDGNWDDKYTTVFHSWDKDDGLRYVGTRFGTVDARVTHAPGTSEPSLSSAAKESNVPSQTEQTNGAKPETPTGLPAVTMWDGFGSPFAIPAPVEGIVQPPISTDTGTVTTSPPESSQGTTATTAAPIESDGGDTTVLTVPTPTQVVAVTSTDNAPIIVVDKPNETSTDGAGTADPGVFIPVVADPGSGSEALTPATDGGSSDGAESANPPPTSHDVHLEAFVHSVSTQESGNNPTVVNDIGASGLFQYMPSTWGENGRGGYKTANLAPAAFQYEQGAKDMQRLFEKFKKKYPQASTDEIWFDVATAWYAGEHWKEKGVNPYKKQMAAGKEYPSIATYANQVVERMNNYLQNPDKMPKIPGLSSADNDLRIE